MGRDAMACVACHVFADRPADGTPGTDLTRFAERLRYEWFRAFLLDPARYKPGTRMPAFGAGGRSSFRSVYSGDMLAQIDAMWSYFALGEFMPVPAGLEPSDAMLLEVEGRPRVFRSFLEGAGSRGIAVGFPIGVHYAFDAQDVRLVDAWRGSFLDASGAWASRGGDVTDGRGPVLWTALPGPPLAIGARPREWPQKASAPSAYRFEGYRLDAAGVPELRYSIEGVSVLDRIEPRLDALVRRITLSGVPAGSPVWLRVGADDRVVEQFSSGATREARGTADGERAKVCEIVVTRGGATLVWTIPLGAARR
jgi:hypothetical protein